MPWACPAASAQIWSKANRRVLAQQQRVSDVGGGFGAVSRMARMLLQSAVLAVGAYLVMAGEVTSGVMIASSILSSRALAPVEMAIANWKGFVAARQQPQAARRPAARSRRPRPIRCRCRLRASRWRSRTSAAPPRAEPHPGRERQLLAARRGGPRHHRAERVGKVDRRADDRRRLAEADGQGPARRRGARPMGARAASASTSATCRRTSSSSPARSPRTSPASIRRPSPTR